MQLQANGTLSSLKVRVQRIFDRLGGVKDNIGLAHINVTESNMMEFLGLIEQRVSKILQQDEALDSPNEMPSNGGALQASYESISITPPTTVDTFSDDDESPDDASRPFSRLELEKKTQITMSTRAKSSR